MIAFWTRFGVSLAAIFLMVGLAAWAKIAKPQTALTPDQALQLLILDYPLATIERLWIADDGAGAIGRHGDLALLLFRVGDSYVTRSIDWEQLVKASPKSGRVLVNLHEFEAPNASFAVSGVWPPVNLEEAA